MSLLDSKIPVPKPYYQMAAMAAVGCVGLSLVCHQYNQRMAAVFMLVVGVAQAFMAVKQYREQNGAMQLSRHGFDVECRFTQKSGSTYHVAVNGKWAAEKVTSPYMLRNVPEGARISLAEEVKSGLTLVGEGKA